MVGLSSFALKPGPSSLSDAGSPVYPFCETGASDAAVTISLQNRHQGEGGCSQEVAKRKLKWYILWRGCRVPQSSSEASSSQRMMLIFFSSAWQEVSLLKVDPRDWLALW